MHVLRNCAYRRNYRQKLTVSLIEYPRGYIVVLSSGLGGRVQRSGAVKGPEHKVTKWQGGVSKVGVRVRIVGNSNWQTG